MRIHDQGDTFHERVLRIMHDQHVGVRTAYRIARAGRRLEEKREAAA